MKRTCEPRARERLLSSANHSSLSRPGTLQGMKHKHLTPGKNRKTYAFGTLNFYTWRLTFLLAERKRSGEFVTFCRQLLRRIPPARSSAASTTSGFHATGTVDRLLAVHPRLVFVPLSTYSPYLNPIEPVLEVLEAVEYREPRAPGPRCAPTRLPPNRRSPPQ